MGCEKRASAARLLFVNVAIVFEPANNCPIAWPPGACRNWQGFQLTAFADHRAFTISFDLICIAKHLY